MSAVIMPGGWHYLQDGVVPIHAQSYEQLPAAVERYRVENGIPLGDVAADVEAQICERFPSMCHDRRAGGVISVRKVVHRATSKTPMTVLLDDVAAWLRSRLSREGGLRLVTKDRADQRAQACKECPKMVRYGGCPDCVMDVERKSTQVRMSQDTTHSRRVGGCSALRIDCRSAVFLDRDVIEPTPKSEPPASCWYLRNE